MSQTDRAVRIFVALLVFYLYYSGTLAGGVGIALMIISIVFVLTSLVSFCPLYRVVGFSSCKEEEKPWTNC